MWLFCFLEVDWCLGCAWFDVFQSHGSETSLGWAAPGCCFLFMRSDESFCFDTEEEFEDAFRCGRFLGGFWKCLESFPAM